MVSPYLKLPVRSLETVLRARKQAEALWVDSREVEARNQAQIQAQCQAQAEAERAAAAGCRRTPESAPPEPVPAPGAATRRAA